MKRLLKLVIIAIAYRDCPALEPLPGVEEDIRTAETYWRGKGFAQEDITVLWDTPGQDADLIPTHENILRVLKELAASFTDGGFYVLHYSGHGVQEETVIDLKEFDGKDELIVGSDGFGEDGGHIVEKCIIDDQMNEILVTAIQQRRGARLLTVFDCCNSGTILDLPYSSSNDKTGRRSLRQMFVQWSMELLWKSLSGGSAPTFPLYEGIFPRLFATNIPVLCISACEDGQAAYSNPKGGLLTQALYRLLARNDTPRLVDLEHKLKAKVRHAFVKKGYKAVQDVQISSLTPLFMGRKFRFRVPNPVGCSDIQA